jgi:deoxyribodipyrimidine photo-lyase
VARALHWFRSDLRVADNTALAAAARAEALACVFVLDPRLLARADAPRVRFLLDCLARLGDDLAKRGSALLVRRGEPAAELARLVAETGAGLVTWNRDYGSYARARDAAVERAVTRAGATVATFKDRVVFEADELLTPAGRPYAVYTPYKRAWWRRWQTETPPPAAPVRLPPPLDGASGAPLPVAPDDAAELPTGGGAAATRRLDAFLEHAVGDYAWRRDLPAEDGTSRLSPHLRFGTISVRACLLRALEAARDDRRRREGVAKWCDELVWREFYHAILAGGPRPARLRVAWRDDPAGLAAWRDGRTGYPFVDAAMRQLRATGWMHNRARMVAASFLCKHLLVDWRLGERWFMERLVDGDPASNNGGWQWSASTGSDAQPWFRIFNPVAQGERFDPDGAYVRRFVPELRGLAGASVHRPWDAPLAAPDYPAPIVDHATARERALAAYRSAAR